MAERRRMGWYSISLDTLRGWGVFLGVVALSVGGFFGFRYWESHAQQRRAAELIAEAEDLLERLDGQPQLVEFENEYVSGKEALDEARTAYDGDDMTAAVDAGRRSRAVLAAILGYIERRGEGGEATFMSVQGGVELKSGDGEWEQARRGTVLQSDDHVRTSSGGSAEILFNDGTIYTLNPNSQIVIDKRRDGSGAEQAVKMAYGWLNLLTQDRPSRVETPEAEARVERETEAFVSYEQETGEGRYGTVSGAMAVSTGSGQERRLGSLEQVTQSGELLSEVGRLPARPELVSPGDNREVDASRIRELELKWDDVPNSGGYMLQVARNRLFVDNVIDDTGRGKASARLGLRGEGTFYWRVAAESDGEGHGPWSSVRSFRVTSVGNEGDVDPPELHIDAVKRYGSIFIVEGRTEAGADVEVNGEPVQVDADGSFTKPIQLTGEGYGFIVVLARDAWDNVTERKRRVFTESP